MTGEEFIYTIRHQVGPSQREYGALFGEGRW
jgi:hypothetical protein